MFLSRNFAAWLSVVGVSFAAFACTSSDTSTAAPTSDGGATAPGDDAGANDAASASDGAKEEELGDIGRIFAISESTLTADGGIRASHRAGASFVRRTGVDTTTTTKTVGPCVVEILGSGETPTEVDLSAGKVQITGGAKPIDLVPNGDATYDAVSGSVALWNGGETLTVTAAGKDVPAFKTSLTAPGKGTVTAPALPALGADLVVKRNAPWSATWSGATNGQVVFYFEATTPSNAHSATCTFDAKAGKGDVPAAAFADFPAAAGSFDFYVKEAAVASPSGWAIRFTVSSTMVAPSGEGANGSASFE